MSGLQPGDALGPYVVEDEIGRGGFATVYRANDARFGGPVAVKVLASHLAGDPEAVERFLGEARALRAVRNDAVVSVFDIAGTDDARPYMVLQYADRATLLERLATGNGADDEELAAIAAFFARSLGALHEHAMVHRDVKPSNVLIESGPARSGASGSLLRPDDRLLLGDLGLVKDLSTGSPVTRGSGSAAYAAPEQRAVVSRVDIRSDIYSASAVVAEAALGRMRRPDETWEDVLRAIATAGRGDLATALRRGLSEDPGLRPPDVQTWSAAIRQALGADGRSSMRAAADDSGNLGAVDPGRRRRRLASVSALLVALVAAVLLFTNRGDPASSTVSAPAVPATQQPAEVETEATTTSPGSAAPVEPTASPEESPAVGLADPPADPDATPTAIAESAAPAPPPTPIDDEVLGVSDSCSDPTRGVAEELAPTGFRLTDFTDSTATIEWEAKEQAYSIFVDNKYFDNARPKSNQYVVEDLVPGTAHDIVMAAHSVPPQEAALICVALLVEPVDRLPVGLVKATDLVASEITSTSMRLSWTPAVSGGRYTLYSGTLAEGKNFPDIIGAGGAGPDETSFVFTELEAGTEAVVGLRTVLGENQSGLAWILVDLPAS